MNNKIAVSVPEAAQMIGVSKSKMYELIRRDDADFILKLDGRTLIVVKLFEEWVKRHAGKW